MNKKKLGIKKEFAFIYTNNDKVNLALEKYCLENKIPLSEIKDPFGYKKDESKTVTVAKESR